jgi:3-oxoadipate enol-lactonase
LLPVWSGFNITVNILLEKPELLARNGVAFNCRLRVPENRPVVLFCNSLLTDCSMWDDNLHSFLDRYRVLTYDMPGQGQSKGSGPPPSIASLADDVAWMLNQLGIDRVHFVGLSLGGLVGQQFAIEYPSRLESLVLCCTASEMTPESIWDKCLLIAAEDGMGGLVEDTLRYWFQHGFFHSHPAVVERFRRMILGTDVGGYMGLVGAIKNASFRGRLSEIVAPTLIVAGRRDAFCRLEQAYEMSGEIRNSRMVVVGGAGHMLNAERPAEFCDHVGSFLDALP